jgi:hypothetical protein
VDEDNRPAEPSLVQEPASRAAAPVPHPEKRSRRAHDRHHPVRGYSRCATARPLFTVWAILLIAGRPYVSRFHATLAAVSGLLAYLSMFELSAGAGSTTSSICSGGGGDRDPAPRLFVRA